MWPSGRSDSVSKTDRLAFCTSFMCKVRASLSPVSQPKSRHRHGFSDTPVVFQCDGGGAFVWSIRQHSGHLHTFFRSVPMPSPKSDRCRSYTISTSHTGHFGVVELAFLGK